MGGSGVTDDEQRSKEQLTDSELYHKLFPEYLAMGMTYRQFWIDDCRLVIAYREAYRLRQEEQNRLAWLQGYYIYRALHGNPLIVGLADKRTKFEPYPNKPIDFTPQKAKTAQEKLDDEMREKSERIQRNMMEFATSFNAQRREKELKNVMEGVTEDA